MSETEAENALDRILNTIGAPKNFVLVPCGEISNASAVAYNGLRYILYDREFMELIISKTNDWSSFAILAHEVGHHIKGHTVDVTMYSEGIIKPKSLEIKRKQELEADEFAGFVMARLGTSLNNALSFTKIFTEKDDTYSTHPTKSKRVIAVRKGYNKARVALSSGEKNKIPPEYKRKDSRMSVESFFNRGIRKFESNDFRGAISDFDIVIEINPINKIAYFKRAYSKSMLGQSFGAITDYSKAIEIDPNDPFIYFNRGYEYNKLGTLRNQIRDIHKAIKDFSNAININPNFSNAYLLRGVSYLNLKKYPNALSDYSKAINLNPKYDLAYSNRGVLKDILKQHSSALNDHNIAINLNPDDANHYFNRSVSKYYLDDLEGTCIDLKTSIDMGNEEAITSYMKICK